MFNKSKNPSAGSLAYAGAIWAALFMLVLWLLANMGIYVSAAEQMAEWHMYFNLTTAGLIGGMIEAAIVSYILIYSFVWVYNSTSKKK